MSIFDRYDMEKASGWRDITVPGLSFPPGWIIKVIPPFAGAAARFHVQHRKASVSVYLDTTDSLGFVGQPYWEIYPDASGDTDRYMLADAEGLMKALKASVAKQNRAK